MTPLNLTPAAILDAALELHPAGLAFACSLGMEDMVLLHLIRERALPIRAFVLDTGWLPSETLAFLEQVQARYGALDVFRPDPTTAAGHGPEGIYQSRERRLACCEVRKLEPLSRALAGAPGWITGQRRAQSSTRSSLQPFERDWAHGGILKVNPLAAWSLSEVRAHLAAHRIPANPLHDLGYPSLGCAPCTRAIPDGADERSGRWWWEAPEQRECGLHVHSEVKP